ncbi:hypothetical protein JCGZ_04892 [Jatropha curcas]|uniref:(S)-hydroxynitrile lyase n=2 Tax=Jatropha curcas TaxID=180498 RepID=A0A067L2F5_JATCU|nr:hypothetical protein JCGZ_04892 [Jatropha curcas]
MALSMPPHSPLSTPSKHFVLIHGACHGAWAWFKLLPLLRAYGYNVTAIDLAASGIDPQQVNTFGSISDYFRPLRDLMASLPQDEKVILVGHSFGGIAISQAMELFPEKIYAAVFLTAIMPGPSLNLSTITQESERRVGDQLDNRYTRGDGNTPATLTLGPMFLKSRMYQLSPTEDWTLATTLMRPEPQISEHDLSSGELTLTTEKYGSIKKAFIISEKDLTIEKDFQEWMIARNPPNLVERIFGSDHMVMMSKPRELSASLLRIAQKVKYL